MTIIDDTSESVETKSPSSPTGLAAWSLVAAFGTYFCMYAFRKPYTAAAFAGVSLWGIEAKTLLVTSQVLGYTLAKLVGIRVIAETPANRRAVGILILIGVAELALLAFGVSPGQIRPIWMFLNGLALGMVFGLVIGFLEGRRVTEALTAGLCASFILADGVTKSVGTWFLDLGVSENWMPGVTGLAFLPPLLTFTWMLSRIPPPNRDDVAMRSERRAMSREDQFSLVRRYGVGLFLLVLVYFLVTIARSIRADFAPEIWRGLGVTAVPSTFANSEILVALVVLVANGLSILIVDNRRAFFASIGVSMAGGVLMLAALAGLSGSRIDGFTFMVLVGTGLYLPYVAIHTTLFERLIAMTRERGNLGFLMYIADSAGYVGYAVLMVARSSLPSGPNFLDFFKLTCGVIGGMTCLSLLIGLWFFARPGWSAVRPEDRS
ncbi:DUF5690 family protein [Tundrisphaera lichenicola]|uniref:DUF5690 family protein n=1 Tax=Tundrisphaera lichenicola TaxID=2029860 RepID=UPI003EBA75B0